jgi:hypothetical protein
MSRIGKQFHGKLYFLPLLLLIVDAALSFYAYASGNILKIRFVFFSFGIAAAWLLFATGVAALYSIRRNSLAAGLFLIHGFINGIALLVLSAFWSHEYKSYPSVMVQKLPVVLLKWLLLAILVAGIVVSKKAGKKLAVP